VRVHAALLLALVVLLAGCAGPTDVGPTPTPAPEPTTAVQPETTTGNSTDEGTATGDDTSTPTPVAAGESPWGSDPVVVGIDPGPAASEQNLTTIVREATAYWEANAEQYAGYAIDYRVDPDATDPDVRIEFVESVADCGDVADAVGCAPLITDRRQIDRPVGVSVVTGLSDESTVLVVQHELGHTLGLTHDDAPQDVMAARSVLFTQPRPDATERDFPWADGEFTVYVDAVNASDPAGVREQVGHALDYYEAGAPGMPDNLTFRRVDSRAEADLVVDFADESPCDPGDGPGSCVATFGSDPDGDQAIEQYSRLRVTLVRLDTDAVGWHVGYWLAYGLGAEDDADKPAPFRDASYDERRSEWWH
jgi:hypothetical protein